MIQLKKKFSAGSCFVTGMMMLATAGVVHAQTAAPATAPGARRGGGGGSPYPFTYAPATTESILANVDRVVKYIDERTPSKALDSTTGQPITDFSQPNPNYAPDKTGFSPTSYEWGVTYSGLIRLYQVTGDAKYKDFVVARYEFLSNMLKMYGGQVSANRGGGVGPGARGEGAARGDGAARGEGGAPATQPVAGARRGGAGGGRGGGAGVIRAMVAPGSLDDSGSMASAMLEARLAQIGPDMMTPIQTKITWITERQQRLSDGTLARSRPFAETLWLDDLYMSVPALANMGKVTGDKKYYDDACRQLLQMGKRMFIPSKGLWMHGWTENPENDHPEFCWARANGWAIISLTETLDVLPEDHPQRAEVMKLYRAHIKGLAEHQSGSGLWHQLIDRHDSYLETSASAMFVYCMAKGINRGWLNSVTYGPQCQIGWQAVVTKINAEGGVEGTCTAMDLAFDPAYYYYKSTSVTAAHGYGPVLLAGAEMYELVKNKPFGSNFGVIHQVEGRGGQRGGGRGRGQ